MTTPANPADLITWLRAQLDDDERVAREALHPDAVSPGVWTTEHHNSEHHAEPNRCHIAEDRSGHYWSVAHEVFIPNAEHMARHDPARVLADVDAKRRIMDRHGPIELFSSMYCTYCGVLGGQRARDVNWPCPEILDAAAPYAERDGYRSEWAAP